MSEILKALNEKRSKIKNRIYAIKSGNLRLAIPGHIEYLRQRALLPSLEKELKEIEKLIDHHKQKREEIA